MVKAGKGLVEFDMNAVRAVGFKEEKTTISVIKEVETSYYLFDCSQCISSRSRRKLSLTSLACLRAVSPTCLEKT